MKPELSLKNPFWIERHRYFELKHFCLQYPIWKKLAAEFDGRVPPSQPVLDRVRNHIIHDPTAEAAEARLYFLDRIELLDKAAAKLGKNGDRVLYGVTQGLSYDVMHARDPMDITRDEYYYLYRKFFWILDGMRG